MWIVEATNRDDAHVPLAMGGFSCVAWLAVTVLSGLLPAEARAGCNHPWVTRAGQSGPLIDRAVLYPRSHPTIQEPESSPPADPQSPCAGGAVPVHRTCPLARLSRFRTGPSYGSISDLLAFCPIPALSVSVRIMAASIRPGSSFPSNDLRAPGLPPESIPFRPRTRRRTNESRSHSHFPFIDFDS